MTYGKQYVMTSGSMDLGRPAVPKKLSDVIAGFLGALPFVGFIILRA